MDTGEKYGNCVEEHAVWVASSRVIWMVHENKDSDLLKGLGLFLEVRWHTLWEIRGYEYE